jgi:hypothetical protein
MTDEEWRAMLGKLISADRRHLTDCSSRQKCYQPMIVSQ